MRQRHPEVAVVMIRELQGFGLRFHLEGVVRARQVLVTPRKGPHHPEAWLAIPGQSCQTLLGHCCVLKVDLLPMLLSFAADCQAHHARRTSVSAPCSSAACVAPSPSWRVCRCGRPLDSNGHHRAACAVAGVRESRVRGGVRSKTKVSRKGGKVTTNIRIQDMDIVAPNQLDERRIEILVDGLPLLHGAQIAVDTTLVSVLRRDGAPPLPLCRRRRCRPGGCPADERAPLSGTVWPSRENTPGGPGS